MSSLVRHQPRHDLTLNRRPRNVVNQDVTLSLDMTSPLQLHYILAKLNYNGLTSDVLKCSPMGDTSQPLFTYIMGS